MLKVWNKRDRKTPSDAVYVGRPTKWGNPWTHFASSMDPTVTLVASREDAIEKFLLWITSDARDAVKLREDARHELRGRHLVCWCSPNSCHGDILLQIANDDDL